MILLNITKEWVDCVIMLICGGEISKCNRKSVKSAVESTRKRKENSDIKTLSNYERKQHGKRNNSAESSNADRTKQTNRSISTS